MQLTNEQRNDLLEVLCGSLANTDASPTRTLDAVMTYLDTVSEDEEGNVCNGSCPGSCPCDACMGIEE